MCRVTLHATLYTGRQTSVKTDRCADRQVLLNQINETHQAPSLYLNEVMSFCQMLRETLQWVGSPVPVVPAQKPSNEDQRFKSLFHHDCGDSRVSVGWVALDVPDHCTENTYRAVKVLVYLDQVHTGRTLRRQTPVTRWFYLKSCWATHQEILWDHQLTFTQTSFWTHLTLPPLSSPPRQPGSRSKQTPAGEHGKWGNT